LTLIHARIYYAYILIFGCYLMNKTGPFSVKEAHDSTGFLLWQVTALWQRKIAASLRSHGITQVQFALLASLLWYSKKEANITQIMLAKHTKLDIMMTSQVLRALEIKGFVKRQTHPTDTRAKMITLTKKGTECVWKAVPDVENADADFFKALSSHHKQFNTLLSSLIDKTGDNHVD